MIQPVESFAAGKSPLRVGFILLPHFTLLPFAAFIDTLRLAADEGDQSRQIHCRWTVMGENTDEVTSSCGVSVRPWEVFRTPSELDYIVVVGGLMHRGPVISAKVVGYLKRASKLNVPLVGLCTGAIALVQAGLMTGRRCCVSWFHYKDLLDNYRDVTAVADQLYVDDGDRITCAGGVVAADLAAMLVERHLGRQWARKSLRILVMDSARSGETAQPQPGLLTDICNPRLKKALLLMEQHMSKPLTSAELAARMNVSKRQLERLCQDQTGNTLHNLYRDMRLCYGMWLLEHTERTVTEIAQECGFSDAAHFSRLFRGSYGRSPSEYRASLIHGSRGWSGP